MEIFKGLFALPRPYFMDSKVLNLELGQSHISQFEGNGAKSLLELPAGEALGAFRAQTTRSFLSYVFPSGHVSTTTALWGGAAHIFKSKKIRKLAPFMVALMALSRMNLGRHFLGDIIGGACLGLFLLLTFSSFLKSPFSEIYEKYMKK